MKLKICHIITRMIVGGAQENTLFTIIGHVQKGHEVVLVSGPSPGPEGELLKKSEYPDFETVINPHLIREINPWHDIAAYFSLKKFFKTRNFDVVHTHSSKAGVIARAAATAVKVPFVVHTVHGQAFHRNEKPWKNFIYIAAERFAAKRCHKIYAVAQAMIDQCVEAKVAPPEKYMVVYSGMELEPFLNNSPDCELRKKLKIPENAPVVGTVARLFPLKGYEDFVPAAAKIAAKIPEVRFLLVGDGIMKPNLEIQVEKLGLKENFIFAGLVPPSEIYRYTSLMNVLVHLSLREGLPRCVTQALASGIPAVGYNLDGTPEIVIEGQTGHITEPGDVDRVAKVVIDLLQNPEKAKEIGDNGRKLIAEKFGWQKMADILEEEYLKGVEQNRDN